MAFYKADNHDGNVITVNKDFTIRIPYGSYYENDKTPHEAAMADFGNPNIYGCILRIIIPKDKDIVTDDIESLDTKETNGSINFIFANDSAEAAFNAEDGSEIPNDPYRLLDTDLDDRMDEGLASGAHMLIYNFIRSLSSQEEEVRKSVKDDQYLKTGYVLKKTVGLTAYSVVILTTKCSYLAKGTLTFDDPSEIEEYLDNLLESITPLGIDDFINGTFADEEAKKPDFVIPTYEQGNKAELEGIIIPVPDGYEYITEDHIPSDDEETKNLTDKFKFLLAPGDSEGGLLSYEDAPMSMNVIFIDPISAASYADYIKFRESVKAKYQLSNKLGIRDYQLKIAADEPRFWVCSVKAEEASGEEKDYRVCYMILVVCNLTLFSCSITFNGKRSDKKNYRKALDEFCSLLKPQESYLDEDLGFDVPDASGVYTLIPTYNEENMITTGTITFPVPDSFEYFTEDHTPLDIPGTNKMRKMFSFACVPSGRKEGFEKLPSSPLAIAQMSLNIDISKESWDDAEKLKEALPSFPINGKQAKINYIKKGEKFCAGIAEARGASTENDGFWKTYLAVVLSNYKSYMFYIFYNGRKADKKIFKKVVEDFCKRIEPAEENTEN